MPPRASTFFNFSDLIDIRVDLYVLGGLFLWKSCRIWDCAPRNPTFLNFSDLIDIRVNSYVLRGVFYENDIRFEIGDSRTSNFFNFADQIDIRVKSYVLGGAFYEDDVIFEIVPPGIDCVIFFILIRYQGRLLCFRERFLWKRYPIWDWAPRSSIFSNFSD